MISKLKILEFYHTLRKTCQLDVQVKIGPIKVRPYFYRPNPTLNAKLASFPQSLIKFKYFLLRNHCQIEFLTRGKLFWPILKFPVFDPFLPIRFRKQPNHPFLRLKLYFPSKPHRFLKKRSIFLGKSVIWPIWPVFGQIWLLGVQGWSCMVFSLLLDINQP